MLLLKDPKYCRKLMLFVVLSLFAGSKDPSKCLQYCWCRDSGLTRTHTVPRAMPIDGISFKFYRMDCFGTHFKHVQSCDVTRVQSATEWTASVHTWHICPKLWCNSCSKCYGMDCFGTYMCDILDTCPKLWCNSCSKCYGMDCFGTYLDTCPKAVM